MWEVYIGKNRHAEFTNKLKAEATAARLTALGHLDVTVVGTESLSDSAPVEINALPYSMRNKAA
jgi:hypothetical protein